MRVGRSPTPGWLALTALLCLAACGEADPLAGRTFVSESVQGYEIVAQTSLRLSFSDGEMRAYAGCNITYAGYAISNGRLTMTGRVVATQGGCDLARAEQDSWFFGFLMSDPLLTVDEPRITLTDDETVVTLLDREVAEPNLPLVGTAWMLDGVIDMDGFGFGDWPATVLRFSDDETFAIEAGCPTAQGQYAVEGQSLVLSGVTIEVDGCPAEAAYEVDIATTVLADGTTELEIDSSRLTLMRGDQGLSFRGP